MSRDERVSAQELAAIIANLDQLAQATNIAKGGWSDAHMLALDLRDSRAREKALRSALEDIVSTVAEVKRRNTEEFMRHIVARYNAARAVLDAEAPDGK